MSLSRGRFVDAPVEALTTATVHPSSILRAPDDETRRTELRAFVKDLSSGPGSRGRRRGRRTLTAPSADGLREGMSALSGVGM